MATTHLKSLQALELAIRLGSLKAAAERLNITPAAAGQRIRALEDYLGTDLLTRGRSGLQPAPELAHALGDLQAGFAALERATEALDFQRVHEIQVVAETDWADLWLIPRLPAFRAEHPNIRFCINGTGDVPLRLGAPDLRVDAGAGPGEALYTEIFLPVTGPDNLWRIQGKDRASQMEGMPLLHLKAQVEDQEQPGWPAWFRAFGYRESGPERGIHYKDAVLALEAARQNVGFLLCGFSLAERDLAAGLVVRPFPAAQNLTAAHPWRMRLRPDATKRPQLMRFAAWLREEARQTRRAIDAAVARMP